MSTTVTRSGNTIRTRIERHRVVGDAAAPPGSRHVSCRPESLPRYMDYIADGLSRALQAYNCPSTIFKTTGPWDTDAVGITSFMPEAGSIAGPDNQPHRWHMMGARNVWSPWRHIQNGLRMFFGR